MKKISTAHGVAMGKKTAVSFANIFMAEIEANLIQQNNTKPVQENGNVTFWWRFLPLGL